MRQKYQIFEDDNDQLVIRELAELDKEEYVITCEETYDKNEITALIDKDLPNLVRALQTPNLYPPKLYMQMIAGKVVEFFSASTHEQVEVMLDDMDFIVKAEEAADKDDENVKIDELIDDAIESDTFSENDEIKEISKTGPTSLKVADDDSIDIDDDIV